MPLLKQLCCVVFFWSFLFQVSAQSQWQVAPGIQYQRGRNSTANKAQPLEVFSPQVSFERIIEFSKVRVMLTLHNGWQRIRGEGSNIFYRYPDGVQEKLQIDNLIFGGGLQFVFWKERKIRPLFGFQYSFGIPLKAAYEMRYPGFNPLYDLPLFFSAKKGGQLMNDRAFYGGFQTNYNAKCQIRFKLGVGHHNQGAAWSIPLGRSFSIDAPSYSELIRGSYWLGSLEVIRRLGK